MYEIPELEKKIEELKGQLAQMTQERDDIQLRLHAIDHAYNEMSKAEGSQVAMLLEENAKALETISRQRQFIRTLYTSRKARKGKGSTSAQSERENALKVRSGGNAQVSEGNLKSADVIRQEEGLRSGQIGCNGQAEMRPPCNHSYVTFTFGTVACIYCKKVHKLNETT